MDTGGGAGSSYDQVIWVSNFAIYKAHLQACHGIFQDPLHIFKQEALCLAPLFCGVNMYVQHLLTLQDG